MSDDGTPDVSEDGTPGAGGDDDVGASDGGTRDTNDGGAFDTNGEGAPETSDREDPGVSNDGDADVDLTRRALVLAGAMGLGFFALFAVDDGRDQPDVSYDTDALGRVVDLGTPTSPRTFPVSIGSEFVESRRERAESLLASAPEDPDIPNEAVAREYADRYEHATDALSRAEEAQSPYERLDALQSAQWFAADVSAVYAVFAGDLTLEDVLARREPVRDRLADFRERWRYLGDGDDPGVALAVHAELESRVDYAAGQLERADEIHRGGEPCSSGRVDRRHDRTRPDGGDARAVPLRPLRRVARRESPAGRRVRAGRPRPRRGRPRAVSRPARRGLDVAVRVALRPRPRLYRRPRPASGRHPDHAVAL
ncbi:hypothetical protein [Salinigranum sp. GCM10025319]|uniref:hypothetical protein n=1 Tax=Salinigranum sp. GCM10025319 TaxID=3252687 RepID=UPI0036230494